MKTRFFFLSLWLCACGGITGSGSVTMLERQVPDFRRISIESAFVAQVTTGARSVSLRTDDNIAPLIETVVENETLIVRVKKGSTLFRSTVLEVTIANEVLEGVEASGASKVTMPATPVTRFTAVASGSSQVDITGLSSQELGIEASGASQVTVMGTATTGSALASGSSEVSIQAVPLESLSLEVSGSSTVDARVSSSLTGTVSGVSTVNVTGSPANQTQVSGNSAVNLNVP